MDMYHLNQIPSDAQIRKYIRRIVFGKNIFCPCCKSRNVALYEKRYRCRKCRTPFSLLSHTWLGNMKISPQKFWLVLWCWTNQMPVKQTMALSGFSEKSVRYWYDSFRDHLPKDRKVLEHIVQLDEAYFGGMVGYSLFMGKQKGTRKLAYRILSHNAPSRHDALVFLKTYVKSESTLQTDGGSIYKNINKYYPVNHMVDIHKKFEFTNTSEIEGMFGVLRTFIRRMYHHVTAEKFPDLMCEFYFRFSHPEMFKSPYHYLLNTLSLGPTG